MKIAGIILIILLLAILLLFIIPGFIAYFALAVPAMKNAKPLTIEQISICRQIVLKKMAYPWVCKKAIKLSRCPCLPCKKLEAGMRNNKNS